MGRVITGDSCDVICRGCTGNTRFFFVELLEVGKSVIENKACRLKTFFQMPVHFEEFSDFVHFSEVSGFVWIY